MRVFGTGCPALLGTGAVRNIILSSLLTHPGVKPKSTRQTKTVASGAKVKRTEIGEDISATFADVTTHMKLLVIESIPVDVLIGLTILKELYGSTELGTQFVDVEVGEKTV